MTQAVVRLHCGSLGAEVCPAFGGRVLSFFDAGPPHRHWLRPIGRAAALRGEHVRGGCFPMVPFSNRIRDGLLVWNGRPRRLAADPLGAPHAMHGFGWRRAWRITEQRPDSVLMRLRHDPDASWPFACEVRQSVRLSEDRLELTLRLTNLDGEPMPAGLGWHPYFPLRSGAELGFDATGCWPGVLDHIPERRLALAPRWRGTLTLRRAAPDLMYAFDGWRGAASIRWRDAGLAMRMDFSRVLAHGIAFRPADADFFCLEPASHAIDGFNLFASSVRNTGTRTLAPGASLSARMALLPDRGARADGQMSAVPSGEE
jgi:aldose 1-epimerase